MSASAARTEHDVVDREHVTEVVDDAAGSETARAEHRSRAMRSGNLGRDGERGTRDAMQYFDERFQGGQTVAWIVSGRISDGRFSARARC
jgi:hypothetical protein